MVVAKCLRRTHESKARSPRAGLFPHSRTLLLVFGSIVSLVATDGALSHNATATMVIMGSAIRLAASATTSAFGLHTQ